MNKVDFLRRLDKELSVLDKEERKELLDFYEERFHSGKIYENKTEQEIISELESPQMIAKNILAEYGVSPKFVKTKEERYQGIDSSNLIVLILFDLFVATWLIPSLFSVAFAILASLLSYVGVLPLIIGTHSQMDTYFFFVLSGAYFLLFVFGLIVLDFSIYISKKILMWHLNVFKFKNREKLFKRLNRLSIDGWFKKHRLLNTVKNFATIGSFVVIGWAGFLMLNSDSNYIDEMLNKPQQTMEYTEDLALDITDGDIWNITTDFENMVVEVRTTTDSEMKVVHTFSTEEDDFTILLDPVTNTLAISNDYENRFVWNIKDILSEIFNLNKVIIYVPEGLEVNLLDISSANGELDIKGIDVEELQAITLNGTVTIKNVNVIENMIIETLNGRVILEDVTGTKSIDVSTSNGMIHFQTVSFQNYTLDTSNGAIKLYDLNSPTSGGLTLNADTSNGAIYLKNVYIANVDADTSNGDITFLNDNQTFEVDSFKSDTSNGSVETNVR